MAFCASFTKEFAEGLKANGYPVGELLYPLSHSVSFYIQIKMSFCIYICFLFL
uniref:Uncharacterized protein n=1 Tax=Arundo donax TaxID=35708 RepID=A0A0A9QLW5_ARUDO